jgi:hypothetical protein
MAVKSANELLRDPMHKAVDAAADTIEPVTKWIDEKKQYLCDEHEKIAKFVSAHPTRSILGLFALGIIVGKILK